MALTTTVIQELKRGRFEKKEHDWEDKSAAMSGIQRIFSEAAAAEPGQDECFNLETWRCLRLPLQALLKDVRPQLVKEACTVVTEIASACNTEDGTSRSHVAKDGARPLLRDIIPTLLEMLSSGNKVNAHYVDDCIHVVIRRCRFKQIVGHVSEYVRRPKDLGIVKIIRSRAFLWLSQARTPKGKSAAVREACAVYVKEIVDIWGAPYLSRHEAELLLPLHVAIEKLLEDASERARALAREAFVTLATHWCVVVRRGGPKERPLGDDDDNDYCEGERLGPSGDHHRPDRSASIVENADPRATRLLRELLASLPPRPAPKPKPPSPVKSNKASRGAARTRSPLKPTASSANRIAASRRPSPPPPPLHSENDDAALPDFKIGERVKVQRSKLATVRFVGSTQFSTGTWVGVELDACDGSHDGVVGTTRYFECAENHGLFVRPPHVTKLTAEELGRVDDLSLASVTACEHRRFLGELFAELQNQMEMLAHHEKRVLEVPAAREFTRAVSAAAPKLGTILDAHSLRLSQLQTYESQSR